MRCPFCGEENSDDSRFCKNCGKPLSETEPDSVEPPIKLGLFHFLKSPDYLGWSLLATFLCTPLCIVPAVFAIWARVRFFKGNLDGAMQFAMAARRSFWASLIVGLAIQCVYVQTHWNEVVDMYYDTLSETTGVSSDAPVANKFKTVVDSDAEPVAPVAAPENAAPEQNAAAPVATIEAQPEPAAPEPVPESAPSARGAVAAPAASGTTTAQPLSEFIKGAGK